MYIATIISALLFSLHGVQAAGINCDGSDLCELTLCGMSDIASAINALSDDTTFTPGQHIACCGDSGLSEGICAFTQNTGRNVVASEAKTWVNGLINFGCDKCGGFPFEDNNTDEGVFKVDV